MVGMKGYGIDVENIFERFFNLYNDLYIKKKKIEFLQNFRIAHELSLVCDEIITLYTSIHT